MDRNRTRKPNGYWDDWENAKNEILKILPQYGGQLPGADVLQRDGYNAISIAIVRKHGGYHEVRRRLGLPELRKDDGHWDDWEVARREIQRAIDSNGGDFPSPSDLARLDLKHVTFVMEKCGGVRAVRERLGYPSERFPDGYWDSWDNLKNEAREIIAKAGHLPGSRDKGYDAFKFAAKKHGGVREVRERLYAELGIAQNKQSYPPGHWDDWEVARREIQRAIDLNGGYLPSLRDLKRLDMMYLNYVIDKHGGKLEVRRRLGLPLKRHSGETFRTWEKIKPEIERAMEKNGGDLPGAVGLRQSGFGYLIRPIIGLYGGFSVVRQRLGLPQIQSPGEWKDFSAVEATLRPIIEELDEFPSQQQLRERGLSGLVSAIYTRYGGFIAVRDRMGYPSKRVPPGYWKNFDNVRSTLEPIMTEVGHFPTQEELYERNLSGLSQSIVKYYGGLPEVARRMGIPKENGSRILNEVLDAFGRQEI